MDEKKKLCKSCGVERPIYMFYKTGLTIKSQCKPCVREKYLAKNPSSHQKPIKLLTETMKNEINQMLMDGETIDAIAKKTNIDKFTLYYWRRNKIIGS